MTHARTLADLDTPAVVIDVDIVERNLSRVQAHLSAHGLAVRPHVKTHKLPRFAQRQLELGAVGITCQKIGEAEVFADAGIEDILIPYNILGPLKLPRLRELHARTKLSVSADSVAVVGGLADAFAAERAAPLTVLVECDTGMGRCGVQSADAALELARLIERSPGLHFGGLMTYPPLARHAETNAWLKAAVESIECGGIGVPVVSNGGTPDVWTAEQVTSATEHRPGTYIYLDRFHANYGMCALADCALTVLATVVSRPAGERAIIDAGSKSLTSDTLGLSGYGIVREHPDVTVVGLSEEHGHLTGAGALLVGDRIRVVPNHACVVSNLFDVVNLVSGDRLVETVPVAARGTVQ